MGCGKESAALDAVGSRTVSGLLKAKGTMFRKNLGETMGCNEIYSDLIVIQWDVTGSNGIQQVFIMILG